MINKITEIYMCKILVRNVTIWYEIHYNFDIDTTEVNIHYDDDWYQNYDKLFSTYKWYKDYKELKELIEAEIEEHNEKNNISNTIINTYNIQFNIIYND